MMQRDHCVDCCYRNGGAKPARGVIAAEDLVALIKLVREPGAIAGLYAMYKEKQDSEKLLAAVFGPSIEEGPK